MAAQDFSPKIGDTGEAQWTVSPEHLAHALGNEGVRVLATPMLLDLMEIAANNALISALPPDWITLGIHADLRHLKVTPEGFNVTARAVITAVDRQKVQFRIDVHDDVELVGQGTHERFCMPRSEFLRMVEKKRLYTI
jgi:predicted thioesterase